MPLVKAIFGNWPPCGSCQIECQCSLQEVVERDILITIGAIKGLLALLLGEAHLHKVSHLVVHGDLLSVVLRPLGRLSLERLHIVLVHLGHDGILRVI